MSLEFLAADRFSMNFMKMLRSTLDRVRNRKFARNLKFATSKTLVNFMKKMMFLSKIGIFSSKSLNLLYSQQISPQLIYFISIFTCGEFQICGEF